MTGKVVVITGASDGIGYSVAEAMGEAGGDVVLWYNSNDAAIEKSKDLARVHGIRAAAYKVDVSEATQVSETIKRVVESFGKIDVFIANAGRPNFVSQS